MLHPEDVVLQAKLVVCVGTGGVGKTTTSAALALHAARAGRSVLVLTIDPAKRLATAMGLESLGNSPQPVDLSALGATGSLHAMMLDAKETFDDLIRRTAGERAPVILENRIYKMMSERLTGTQEYMALERLFDLYQGGQWDLVVLDTPPSTNALDFFDAPRRTAQMFDESVMRWFLPTAAAESGGFFQRVFNPGAVVQKLLATVGGDAFMQELADFFDALAIVRASFEERGHRVSAILRDPATRYVLVLSPDARRVQEALSLHAKLKEMGKSVSLFLINRSHADFDIADLRQLRTEGEGVSPEVWSRALGVYAELAALGERDRDGVARLRVAAREALVHVVPSFDRPIHALESLAMLAEAVVGRSLRSSTP